MKDIVSKKPETFHLFLFAIFLISLIISLIRPYSYMVWILETLPAIIGVVVLILTYNKFRLSNLLYVLILFHCIILIIGAHYTYAEVPLFNWIRDAFDLSRNHYDRLGHVIQGFVPALICREYLLRKSPLSRGKLLNFIIICICLAISASYELLEFASMQIPSPETSAFLGSQGDIWDAQWDMLLALIGSIFSLAFLSKTHDKFLNNILQK